MILAPTWKAYFAARESNAHGDKHPAAYLSAWSDDTPSEAKLQLLTNDPDTAILTGDSGNNVMVLLVSKTWVEQSSPPPTNLSASTGATAWHPLSLLMRYPSPKPPS